MIERCLSPPKKRRGIAWTELLHRFARMLLAPIDGVTLGFFRIGFACALFMQALKWSTVIDDFLKSGTLLSYPMFAWVPPARFLTVYTPAIPTSAHARTAPHLQKRIQREQRLC